MMQAGPKKYAMNHGSKAQDVTSLGTRGEQRASRVANLVEDGRKLRLGLRICIYWYIN